MSRRGASWLAGALLFGACETQRPAIELGAGFVVVADAGAHAGSDGGAPDAGPPDAGRDCIADKQPCDGDAGARPCCAGHCINGICQVKSGCREPGQSCRPYGECCFGTNCVLDAGQAEGTCQPSPCSEQLQACGAGAPCCEPRYFSCVGPPLPFCQHGEACACLLVD